MPHYKTKDLEIISPITLGEVIPDNFQIPQIDTSVQNLLAINPYQGSDRQYSGEIQDMSYTSWQDQKQILDQLRSQNPQQQLDDLMDNEEPDEVFP